MAGIRGTDNERSAGGASNVHGLFSVRNMFFLKKRLVQVPAASAAFQKPGKSAGPNPADNLARIQPPIRMRRPNFELGEFYRQRHDNIMRGI
jgi:hypothetical protein